MNAAIINVRPAPRRIGAWTLQILVAVVFFAAGGAKLAGAPYWCSSFPRSASDSGSASSPASLKSLAPRACLSAAGFAWRPLARQHDVLWNADPRIRAAHDTSTRDCSWAAQPRDRVSPPRRAHVDRALDHQGSMSTDVGRHRNPAKISPCEVNRSIVLRTRGHSHGPITRLISPGNMGSTSNHLYSSTTSRPIRERAQIRIPSALGHRDPHADPDRAGLLSGDHGPRGHHRNRRRRMDACEQRRLAYRRHGRQRADQGLPALGALPPHSNSPSRRASIWAPPSFSSPVPRASLRRIRRYQKHCGIAPRHDLSRRATESRRTLALSTAGRTRRRVDCISSGACARARRDTSPAKRSSLKQAMRPSNSPLRSIPRSC